MYIRIRLYVDLLARVCYEYEYATVYEPGRPQERESQDDARRHEMTPPVYMHSAIDAAVDMPTLCTLIMVLNLTLYLSATP